MKTCSKCGLPKELSEFSPKKLGKPTLRGECRPCLRLRSQEWKRANPERTRELSLKSAAAFYEKFPERVRENSRRSYARNPKGKVAYQTRYVRERIKIDPAFKLLCHYRRRVHNALKTNVKSSHTLSLLGCLLPALREHLQKQFRPGMTWENYGPVWHVDHIRPCASFDFSEEHQQFACFNFQNLQPLFADENRRKHARIL